MKIVVFEESLESLNLLLIRLQDVLTQQNYAMLGENHLDSGKFWKSLSV